MEAGDSRGPRDFVFVAKMKTEGQVLLCEKRNCRHFREFFISYSVICFLGLRE